MRKSAECCDGQLREKSWTLTDRLTEWEAMLASARAAHQQAESLIGQAPEEIDPELRSRVDALGRDLDEDEQDHRLGARYDEIRREAAQEHPRFTTYNTHEAARKMREALGERGLHVGETPVKDAKELILARPLPVQPTLLFALYYCLMTSNPNSNTEAYDWVMSVLNEVDPNPRRSKLRQAMIALNADEIRRLAAEPDFDSQPTLLTLLSSQLSPEDRLSLLIKLQAVRPNDFWVNKTVSDFLLVSRRPEEALPYLYSAIAIRPDSAGIWTDIGLARKHAGDLAEAERALRRAVELKPNSARAYDNLGVVLSSRRNFDEAIERHQRAIELKHDRWSAHSNLALALLGRGDITAAEDSARTAIEFDPSQAQCSMILGHALEEWGDLLGAIAAYRRAVQLDPDQIVAHQRLAALLGYTSDERGYQAACRLMFKQFSKSSNVTHLTSLLMAHLHFPEGARPEMLHLARNLKHLGLLPLAHYRLHEDPRELLFFGSAVIDRIPAEYGVCCYLSYALLQLRMGEVEEARNSIREARRIQETRSVPASQWPPWGPIPCLWREVAKELEAAGLKEPIPELTPTHDEFLASLIERFWRTVELNPESAPAHANLGNALLRANKVDPAIEAFEKAIELDPNHAPSWSRLGDAYLHRGNHGDMEKALAAFQKAADLEPKNPRAQANLGRALRDSGALTKAMTTFQLAADLAPENFAGQVEFIKACHEAGKIQQAISLFRRRSEVEKPKWNQYRFLLGLLRYTGDDEGYKQLCRQLLDGYPKNGISRHSLLLAHLLHPDIKVTPGLLKLAKEHAKSRHAIRIRMLGIAYHRLGQFEQAQKYLERAIVPGLIPPSRIQSHLSLALNQLQLKQHDEARKNIRVAREIYESISPELNSAQDWARLPYGELTPLWEEVEAAMNETGLDEAIPELPLKFGQAD